MLDGKKIPYRYRDYRKEPLSAAELRTLLKKLGLRAADVLRPRDPVFKRLGLGADASDTALIPLMAEHPTLLQRPIGVRGGRAVVGRPPENLLDLAG